jgi:AcrR family transcriptional regulator
MPRSAALNRELREASRGRILEVAVRLFAERGYAATPVDAIVAGAGISPGLLYHYFPSKLDLLRAVFDASMEDVRASFAAADAAPTPSGRLAALVGAAVAIVKDHRDFWTLSYGVRMQRDVIAALGPRVAGWTAEIHRVLERYLRDAGWPDAGREALLLFAQIDGLCQHYVLDPEHYPIDVLIGRLIDRCSSPPRVRRPRRRARRSASRRHV